MKRSTTLISVLVFVLAGSLGATSAQAQVPESQASRLGRDLTPIGAERAGEGGDIPAWTGGLSAVPSNISYKLGDHLQDPFASDPIEYTITPTNMEHYEAVLSDGYKALLKAYPDYRLNVYQTRRSCAYPDFVYKATKNNARVGQLIGGGSGIGGAIMGFPFPIPNNALEIIWNQTLRYRSFKLERHFASAATTASGDYTLVKTHDDAIFAWSDPSKKSAEDLDNTSLFYISRTISPARAAGNVVLVKEALNAALQPRQAWQYSPGTRRVRRAPNISYDNPLADSDGLMTTDQFDIYNGAPDRYDWTVIAKKPMIIAVNDYKAGLVDYKDYLLPRHLNQDYIRYELHRVWEIEAKLKPDTRHIYSRRIYYNDEDSWTIANAELYDGRGELWRVQEAQSVANYQVPLCGFGTEVSYDLQAGRYFASAMQNEETPINFFASDLDSSHYNPDAIRQLGVR